MFSILCREKIKRFSIIFHFLNVIIQKSIINIKNFYISGQELNVTYCGNVFYCPNECNSRNYQNSYLIQIWLLLTLTKIFYLLFKWDFYVSHKPHSCIQFTFRVYLTFVKLIFKKFFKWTLKLCLVWIIWSHFSNEVQIKIIVIEKRDSIEI